MPRQSSRCLAPLAFFAPIDPTARTGPRPCRAGFCLVDTGLVVMLSPLLSARCERKP